MGALNVDCRSVEGKNKAQIGGAPEEQTSTYHSFLENSRERGETASFRWNICRLFWIW